MKKKSHVNRLFLVLMLKANLVKFYCFLKFWTFWMERRPLVRKLYGKCCCLFVQHCFSDVAFKLWRKNHMLIGSVFLVFMLKANLVKCYYFLKIWTFWMERRPLVRKLHGKCCRLFVQHWFSDAAFKLWRKNHMLIGSVFWCLCKKPTWLSFTIFRNSEHFEWKGAL